MSNKKCVYCNNRHHKDFACKEYIKQAFDIDEIYGEPDTKKDMWKGLLLIIGFIAFVYAFCYLTVGI